MSCHELRKEKSLLTCPHSRWYVRILRHCCALTAQPAVCMNMDYLFEKEEAFFLFTCKDSAQTVSLWSIFLKKIRYFKYVLWGSQCNRIQDYCILVLLDISLEGSQKYWWRKNRTDIFYMVWQLMYRLKTVQRSDIIRL